MNDAVVQLLRGSGATASFRQKSYGGTAWIFTEDQHKLTCMGERDDLALTFCFGLLLELGACLQAIDC